jgi:hypothetical protein
MVDDDNATDGQTAENLLIFDACDARRTERGVKLAQGLTAQGWTVYAFVGQASPAYVDGIGGVHVRRHNVPIDTSDVQEVLEAKKVHDRVAVVIHGLLSPGGKPMNRLLRDDSVMVVAVSSVRAVRGDHRYSRMWSEGNGWTQRSDPKGFSIVGKDDTETTAAPSSWLPSWMSLW